jgi:hypothetical protein
MPYRSRLKGFCVTVGHISGDHFIRSKTNGLGSVSQYTVWGSRPVARELESSACGNPILQVNLAR